MRRLLLFSLNLLIFLSASRDLPHPPLSASISLQGTAPSNGSVKLYFSQEIGYYANVDLLSKKVAKEKGPSTVPMIPAFYSSETLLVQDCLDFSSYDCQEFNCEIQDQTTSVQYSNFEAGGKQAKAYIVMDNKNWVQSVPILLASNCSTNVTKTVGTGSYGILGMGTAGNSAKIFIGSQVFSIDLDKDGKTGELFFGSNSSFIHLASNLTTDQDWQSHGFHAIQFDETTGVFDPTTLLFDLSSDSIAVFDDRFDFIHTLFGYALEEKGCFFQSEYVVECKEGIQVKNLPTLSFYSSNGWFHLQAPVYIAGVPDESEIIKTFNFNMKRISSQFTNDSSVSPLLDNTIVFGSSIFKYYHVEFDVTTKTVKLFHRVIDDKSTLSNRLWVSNSVVVYSTLVITAALVYKIWKSKQESRKESFGNRYVYAEN